MAGYRARPHHLAIALLIAVLLLIALLWPRKPAKHQDLAPPPTISTPATNATPEPSPRSSAPAPRASESADARASSGWQELQRRFGADLRPEWSADHHLAAIRGAYGKGSPAGSGFDPSDERQVRKRAREILDASGALLGLNAEHPLDAGIYRGDSTSAHLYYQESVGGVPVEPHGAVTIDLGPSGQLTGLYSDYVPQFAITNSVSIDAATARTAALAAIVDPTAPLRATGGEQVIWVTHGEGRHAYEFTVNGRQVIVDAASGKVLVTRDKRVY